MGKTVVWLLPERRGGIRSYTQTLWPAVREASRKLELDVPEPMSMAGLDPALLIEKIAQLNPALIHIQHEFGLFGSKIPLLYRFPAWVKKLQRELPETKICATAHTVLDRNYRYPWQGRGWQAPIRIAANRLLLPIFRRTWIEGTWGPLDGVIVHSDLQKLTVQESGCPEVQVIPHFVPRLPFGGAKRVSRTEHKLLAKIPKGKPVVMVFGFFTPAKGQDLAIQALALSKSQATLLLAGGVRRQEDEPYLARCRELVSKLSLDKRVVFSDGFIPDDQVDEFYARANLVLAPFKETSGSGSLAQAFARSAAVLTSDLPLNLDLRAREPDCMETFEASNATDCARKIDGLLADSGRVESLKAGAKRYADKMTPNRIAELHVEFYAKLLSARVGLT